MIKNTYYVINTTDKDNVDFNEIVQDVNTIRYSLDNSKFIIKTDVDGTEPTFISNGTVTPVSKLTHSEVITLLEGVEWTNNEELI